MRIPMLVALLLAGCAPAPPPGLTEEEEASLDAAAAMLDEVVIGGFPLTEAQLEIYPDARGMPADVQRFIVGWQDCQHWLGEEGWDEERRRQIEQAVSEVCTGIDALSRQVRERHAGDSEVLSRLAGYESLGQ